MASGSHVGQRTSHHEREFCWTVLRKGWQGPGGQGVTEVSAGVETGTWPSCPYPTRQSCPGTWTHRLSCRLGKMPNE